MQEFPDAVRLWDGTVGPSPPEPMINATLGERRAHCVEELLRLDELIEALVRRGADDCLCEALTLRARLLLWLSRYCNEFRPARVRHRAQGTRPRRSPNARAEEPG